MRFSKNTIEIECPHCENGLELDISVAEELIAQTRKEEATPKNRNVKQAKGRRVSP